MPKIKQLPLDLIPNSIVDSYCRDSGGERQDNSTDQQLDEIRAFCSEHNLQLRHRFVDVAKSGGTTAGRDEFNRMIDLYRHKENRPRGLILWNYARFARDFDNAVYYKSLLRTYGIIILSLNDQIPEGDYGRIVEFFIDMSNEEKRRQTSADARRGLRELVQKHGCVPGTPPRGFKRKKVILGEHRDGSLHIAHRWIPDPKWESRILRAFKLRAGGATLFDIQKSTQLFGSINSYSTFFSNKIYIGILEFGDLTINNYCYPIVPLQIWSTVQEQQSKLKHWAAMKSGEVIHPRRINSRFLLSGLAKHATCGSPLYGDTTKGRNGKIYDAYRCTRAHRKRDCTHERIPRQGFEDAVYQYLVNDILDPTKLDSINKEFSLCQSREIEEQNEQKNELSSKLGILRHQKNRVADAIADHGHTRTLLEKLKSIDAEEEQLSVKLNELKASSIKQIPELKLDQFLAIREELKSAYMKYDINEKRALLRYYIAGVDVSRVGNTVKGKIHIYFPFLDPTDPPVDGVSISRNPLGASIYLNHVLRLYTGIGDIQ